MAGNRIKGITVEIGGDTSDLQKSLKGVDSELKTTQNALRDVNKLLKFDPGNSDLLAQKQKLLGQAVEDTKKRLETLKEAANKANEELASGKISGEQYDALQREIIETEQKLQSLEAQAEETNSALNKGFDYSGTSEKMKAAGTKIASAGDTLTKTVTAPLLGLGTAAFAASNSFEEAMAKLSTIADETEVPIDKLKKQIIDLSNQTGISASEIADNVYNAISAGQSTGDAVNFVGRSAQLAKSGFADAGAALDVLTTILNAYGLEASEVNKVSDMLVQTQNKGKTTVGELASSMGKIIPTAKANNVSLSQITAGYAKLTANGIRTAEATTYMNSTLNELGKSSTKVAKALKEKTGKSFSELMADGSSLTDVLAIVKEAADEAGLAFGDMWGSSEAGKAANVLSDTTAKLGDFNAVVAEMESSDGATDAAATKMETTNLKLQKSVNSAKNALVELGDTIKEVIAPVLDGVTEAIQKFTAWFSGLDDGTKQAIVKFALLAAALGPVLSVIGRITIGIGSLIGIIPNIVNAIGAIKGVVLGLFTVVTAHPIIAVITGIVAAIAFLWNNCEVFRESVINLWNALKTGIVAIVNGIKSALTTAWNAIYTSVTATIRRIVETGKSIFNIFVSAVISIGGNIKTAIVNAVEGAATYLSGLPTKAYNWGADMISGFVDGINSMINSVKNAVSGVASDVAAFLHFSRPDIGPLRNYETWMPDFMRGLAKGINANKHLLTDAVNSAAAGMVISPSVAGGYSGGGNAVVNLTQPFVLNGKVIATAVSEIQYAQGKVSLRNLGRK